MKKFLLSMMLLASVFYSKAQAVLNEIYFNPSTGESEYFEIYNSGAFENMNCYTLLSMYDNGTNKGFYVINFPNFNMNSNSFSVGTSSITGSFNFQAGIYTLGSNDFSWNLLNSAGTGGYFKQYQLNASGTGYSEVVPPVNTNDIFNTLPSSAGAKYITLLYKNGVLQNGLIINGGSTSPTALKSTMPALALPGDGTCSGFTANFSAIKDNELEYLIPAIGNSNGAFRTSDGKCGTWNKAANKTDNTPGSTNGPSTLTNNSVIAVGGQVNCSLNANNKRTANYFIVNNQTDAAAYPLTLQLYEDYGSVAGQLDAGDIFIEQKTIATAPANGTPNTVYTAELIHTNVNILVVAKSTAGCFQTIQAISNSCSPLPVKLKSFNANRHGANVDLIWVTATEQNNKGFDIQRLVGAGGWEKVGYVASKADNGNSTSDISYSFTDANNTKGVSQYRLVQTDLDAQVKYSDIRSVKGEGQSAKTIVYPNPSMDGNVKIVFEDASVLRDATLMDVNGRIVKQWNGISTNTLQIENLVSGMYNLRIVNRGTGEQTIEKIMVNKK